MLYDAVAFSPRSSPASRRFQPARRVARSSSTDRSPLWGQDGSDEQRGQPVQPGAEVNERVEGERGVLVDRQAVREEDDGQRDGRPERPALAAADAEPRERRDDEADNEQQPNRRREPITRLPPQTQSLS